MWRRRRGGTKRRERKTSKVRLGKRVENNETQLGATDHGAELGVEVGAMDQGAEPPATSDATSDHIIREPYHLSVEIHGAKMCKLSAAGHDAEVGSIF
jgi:hypothetical protein